MKYRSQRSAEPRGKRQQAGFTLVELMAVVAIIGILSSAVIPEMQRYIRKTTTIEAVANLTMIANGGIAYHSSYGQLPCDNPMLIDCSTIEGWDPVMSHATRCSTFGKHFPQSALNEFNTLIWQTLLFQPQGDLQYRYYWSGQTTGRGALSNAMILAWSDLDCDGDWGVWQIRLKQSGVERELGKTAAHRYLSYDLYE